MYDPNRAGERRRAVLALRQEGRTYRDIAATLGISWQRVQQIAATEPKGRVGRPAKPEAPPSRPRGRPGKYRSEAERQAAKRERGRRTIREDNRRLRLEALHRYGGTCVCCGESTPEFLGLDHINLDGGAHRAEMKGSGTTFLRNMRRLGWPADYELVVRCWNCHYAKDWFGICPHQGVPDPLFVRRSGPLPDSDV